MAEGKPLNPAWILGLAAAGFFCLMFLAIGLKIYFARKVAEEEVENEVTTTWSMSPGPSPAPAPAPASAPAPAPAPAPDASTTSTYCAEPAWKFSPDGYEESD